MAGTHGPTHPHPAAAELAALEFGKIAVLARRGGRGGPLDADALPRPAVVTVMGHVDHGGRVGGKVCRCSAVQGCQLCGAGAGLGAAAAAQCQRRFLLATRLGPSPRAHPCCPVPAAHPAPPHPTPPGKTTLLDALRKTSVAAGVSTGLAGAPGARAHVTAGLPSAAGRACRMPCPSSAAHPARTRD